MNAKELARVVAEMRHEQKRYFQTQNIAVLQECKRLESKVDHCVEIILSGQKELFDKD